MIGIDLGQLLQFLRIVLVVRSGVERIGHADLREGAVTHLARHHEAGNARDVGLERQRHQFHHQLGVHHVIVRDADGGGGHFDALAVLGLGDLDAALDLAHVVQILGDAVTIVRAQTALQMADLRGHRVQDAVLALDAGHAIGGVGAVAKQAIENHARVDFHGERRGGRAPRNGVGVGAAEADVARADQARHVLGRQFERRQRRVLADVRGGNLIHCGARANVLAFGALGMDAVQEDRGGSSMVATAIAGTLRASQLMREIADHHHLVAEGLQRHQGARKLEVGAFGRGSPVAHHPAMRNIQIAQTDARIRGGLRKQGLRRDHRVEKWQGQGDTHAAQKRAAGKMLLRDDHAPNLLFQTYAKNTKTLTIGHYLRYTLAVTVRFSPSVPFTFI